jgi:hypothetical protein
MGVDFEARLRVVSKVECHLKLAEPAKVQVKTWLIICVLDRLPNWRGLYGVVWVG